MTAPNPTLADTDPIDPRLAADVRDTVRAALAGLPPPAHVQDHEAERLEEHRGRDWDETPQEAARADRAWFDDRYDRHGD
ncbi:hypothetical protein [Streptomyces sp. SGAir0957]